MLLYSSMRKKIALIHWYKLNVHGIETMDVSPIRLEIVCFSRGNTMWMTTYLQDNPQYKEHLKQVIHLNQVSWSWTTQTKYFWQWHCHHHWKNGLPLLAQIFISMACRILFILGKNSLPILVTMWEKSIL